MKLRNGFVSNSSSSSFIITNKTDKEKTLVDFVTENAYLLERFKGAYDWYADDPRFTQEQMIKDAEQRDKDRGFLGPKDYAIFDFGDEDGDVLGRVYDYILRRGGDSESFTWSFHESLR